MADAGGVTGPDRARRRPLIRAPLAPVALALAGGIVLGRSLPLPTVFWALCGAVAAVVAGVSLWRTARRTARQRPDEAPDRSRGEAYDKPGGLSVATAAVCVLTACLGAVHVRRAYRSIPDDHVVTFTGRGASLATLRGRIVTAPQTYAPPATAMNYSRPPRTTFLLDADAIRTAPPTPEGGSSVVWQPTGGLVRVTVDEPARDLEAGQRIQVLGRIGRYRPPPNPGQFDFARHARRRGTLVWMRVPAAGGVLGWRGGSVEGPRDGPGAPAARSETPPEPVGRAGRLWWRIKAGARQHLTACADRDDARLLHALILGERHPALRTLNETMVRAGLAHFLSISGLHLGIFLGLAYLLCRLVALSPRKAAVIVLVLLAAYVGLAQPRPPLLRSAIMAGCLCIGILLGRRAATLNALAFAGIILLAIDPLQLFAAGFQLSFAIVTGLILLHRPVREAIFGRWIRRRGLTVFRNESGWRRWLAYSGADRVMDAVTMSLVAFVVAAPLVAVHFGLFSPYAPLLSLLLLPLVLGVLVPGYLSVALALPAPNLAYLVGRVAAEAAGALQRVVGWLEHLPGLSIELLPVGASWAGVCYVAIALLAWRRRLPLGRTLAGVAAAVAVGLGVYRQLPAPAPGAAELNVLAVGPGQCAVLRTPSGQTVLLDAGSLAAYDVHAAVLAPFLRHQRLPTPRAAFLSHANIDHYNALPGLLAGRAAPLGSDGWRRSGSRRDGRLERVYLNEYFGREADAPAPPAVAELMDLLAGHGAAVVRLCRGDVVELDDRTRVEVLWPPAHRSGSGQAARGDLAPNDRSLVLRIVCDDRSVLVPGDLDAVGQAALVADAAVGRCDLSADVLILPHHGSWEASLPAFVETADPEVVLVSSARDPEGPAGHERAREFYARLRRTRRYYVTARDGWVQVALGRREVSVRTQR